MTYRLKDRELQKKLDEISNGDFTKKLETEAQRKFVGALGREVIQLYFGDSDIFANRYSVAFELSEIEEIQEYDPNSWNRWPDVTPPPGIPMRVETSCSRCGFKAQFIDGQWWDMRGDAIFDGPEGAGIEGRIVRFRPWEDTE